MCGLCGRLNFDGRPVSADEISAMRDVMVHRGPDDSGLMIDGAIGLGHRRLSIIDLAGGHQPISNEDGTVTVVFNGEIYNFAELRRDLLARGHVLRTRSDTEVIVHLYEDLGPECVQHFRGMFAFALWDSRRRQLMLARDRLGVKPLYYAQTRNSLIFGSELKSVLQAEGVAPEIDPRGLRRYLAYRHAYGDGTLFAGIRQIPPGHYLVSDATGTKLHRYWNVPERRAADPEGAAAGFLPLLEQAVKIRMITDVPLGSFLSGGIDSSMVTALMGRHTDQVRTFSIGFVPGEEDELGWARKVADLCRADHHEFVLGSEDFCSLLPKLVWHHDEPLTFPASIPLYLLSRESKRVATVMLAGEGADEILAGYDSNVRTYWLGRIAAAIPSPVRSLLARAPLPARLHSIAKRASGDEAKLIAGTFKLAGHQQMISACRLGLPDAGDDDHALLDEIGMVGRGTSMLDRLLYFQLKTYLVALLMKQDKMSMAASIETRVPYLDHHLVELAFSLPDRYKVHGRTGKYLLKSVSRGILPDSVIYRPKKGFPVPIAQWFRVRQNPFLEILLDASTLRDGLIDPDLVRGTIHRFRQGEECAMELWSMINLELWRRAFFSPGAARKSWQ